MKEDFSNTIDRAIFKRELTDIFKEFPQYTIGQCLLRIVRPSCNSIGDLYEVEDKELINNILDFIDNERQ